MKKLKFDLKNYSFAEVGKDLQDISDFMDSYDPSNSQLSQAEIDALVEKLLKADQKIDSINSSLVALKDRISGAILALDFLRYDQPTLFGDSYQGEDVSSGDTNEFTIETTVKRRANYGALKNAINYKNDVSCDNQYSGLIKTHYQADLNKVEQLINDGKLPANTLRVRKIDRLNLFPTKKKGK